MTQPIKPDLHAQFAGSHILTRYDDGCMIHHAWYGQPMLDASHIRTHEMRNHLQRICNARAASIAALDDAEYRRKRAAKKGGQGK